MVLEAGILDAMAQGDELRDNRRLLRRGKLEGLAHSGDAGDVLRSASPPPLLMSAALDGGDLAPGGQKPRALRPGDLVRGKPQQVPGEIEGHPSRRLNRVDVQGNAMFAADGSDFPD